MSNQIITFAAEPPATRWTYAKTALILLVVGEVMNVFAQMRLVQKLELKYSSVVVAILSLLISYFLSRSPLTKSLTIDYVKRLVVVGFMTLMKAENMLEIPFARLGVDTDAPTDAASRKTKWKTNLLLDGKKVYLLLSSESGFTAAQMNEFNERVKECQEAGKN